MSQVKKLTIKIDEIPILDIIIAILALVSIFVSIYLAYRVDRVHDHVETIKNKPISSPTNTLTHHKLEERLENDKAFH